MFCNQCGKEIDNNAKFCQFCGANLHPDKTDLTDTTQVDLNKYKKNMAVSYLCWLFLGFWGVHRFYIANFQGCILYIILNILSLFFTPFYFITGIVWLIDGTLFWVDIKNYNEKIQTCIDENKPENLEVFNIGCLGTIVYLFGIVILLTFCNLLKTLM